LILLGRASGLWDKHFILDADIDLDPNLPGRQVFSKAVIQVFSGVFDGNGHTISHLTLSGGNQLGLFGRTGFGARISNLGLQAVDVSGRWYVGGLVGRNYGSIKSCYSTGSVSGLWHVGGLVGEMGEDGGSIMSCYSTASVSGDEDVGGLVGTNNWGAHVTSSYSTGGGLAGGVNYGSITRSVWDMETSDLTVSNGGVGLTTAEMMDPYMLGLNGFANNPNWILDAGRDYPRLAWEGTDGQTIPEPVIDWLDGQGTAQEPYTIDKVDQLILLRRASGLWDKHFILGADIDLDPNLPGRRVFSQAVIQVFSGVLDGNGHTISHLTIEGGAFLGLFRQLGPGAIISNFALEAVNVSGTGDYVGGLLGCNHGGEVIQCYSTGAVTGGRWSVGGLVGYNGGSITVSYSTGTVSGEDAVGGLVGRNYGSITNCYSTDAVGGYQKVGGLVGNNDFGSIATSYSTGSVSGRRYGGGLVGYNRGSITSCYSTGSVSGDDYVGGSVGRNVGSITSSFWDIQTSGQTSSDGGMGLTTTQMQTASTFLDAGWDFVDETENGIEDIWWILEGKDYPRLWWETAEP
jgi:hypothetical protein